ncbi:MAG TPA: hypothetical protein VKF60_17190, partial [Myxococcota bacterium]|nr:hypothetical protein [Myxococcota bacterium]
NAKGSVLLGPVKYLRKRRDAALELLAPELAHYLDNDVRISAWYPEDDFVALVRASAQLMSSNDLAGAMEAMGAAGAHEHAEVYGALLATTLHSNSSVFALWSAQHDTGRLEGSLDTPTSARIKLVAFDSPSDVICLLSGGYIRGQLTADGWDDIAIDHAHCVLRGDPHCEWRASWKNPDSTPLTPVRRRAR